MSHKVILLVILLMLPGLTQKCVPDDMDDSLLEVNSLEKFNAWIELYVNTVERSGLPEDPEDRDDLVLMWGPLVEQAIQLLKDALPEEVARFNQLLLRGFKQMEKDDPARARQIAAIVLRKLYEGGAPPPPVQGMVVRESASVEVADDVYDYDLTRPAQSTSSPHADINLVTAMAANSNGVVGPLSPSGSSAPIPQNSTGLNDWTVLGPWNGVADWYMIPNRPYPLEGNATFTRPNTTMTVQGDQWTIEFEADGTATITSPGSTHFEYREGPAAQGQGKVTWTPGTPLSVVFSGFSAMLDYDAEAGTLDIMLVEGTATLGAPIDAEFTVAPGSANALLLHVDADGNVSQQQIPVAPDALQRFAPETRSLTFRIDMVEPVAATSAEAKQVWYVLLSPDGDPATGFNEGMNAMFTGLGADVYISVTLQEDGSLAAGGVLPINRAFVPVEAILSADRYTLSVYVPVFELEQQLRAAGLDYSPDRIQWRIASVVDDGGEKPKDVFPEIVYDYSAADDITGTAPVEDSSSEEADGADVLAACTASATSGANLRGGPGTNFAQVGGVAGGDELLVIGVNAAADWYKLRIEGINSAWIAAFLITEPVCPDGFTLPVTNE